MSRATWRRRIVLLGVFVIALYAANVFVVSVPHTPFGFALGRVLSLLALAIILYGLSLMVVNLRRFF